MNVICLHYNDRMLLLHLEHELIILNARDDV